MIFGECHILTNKAWVFPWLKRQGNQASNHQTSVFLYHWSLNKYISTAWYKQSISPALCTIRFFWSLHSCIRRAFFGLCSFVVGCTLSPSTVRGTRAQRFFLYIYCLTKNAVLQSWSVSFLPFSAASSRRCRQGRGISFPRGWMSAQSVAARW